jgi:hypothetical protein
MVATQVGVPILRHQKNCGGEEQDAEIRESGFRARDTPDPPSKIIRAGVRQAGYSTRSEPGRADGSAVDWTQ